MIYCPTDTKWRAEQARRYASILSRADAHRKASVWRVVAELCGKFIVLAAFGFVLAYAIVGG